jgi:phosphopantetheinyl transferase
MWAERIVSIENLKRRFCVAPPSGWLAPGEQQRAAEIRSSQRALQWLSGRWLAKQLLLQLVGDADLTPCELHIESRDGRELGTRPRVYREGRLQSWQLSISHSSKFVYVAASTDEDHRVGVDVTPRQTLSPAFQRFWLAREERAWCRRQGDQQACTLWSLKESWFKAVGGEQTFVPRQLDVVSALCLDRVPQPESDSRRPWRLLDDPNCTVLCRWLPGEVATLVLLSDGGSSASQNPLHRSQRSVETRPPHRIRNTHRRVFARGTRVTS